MRSGVKGGREGLSGEYGADDAGLNVLLLQHFWKSNHFFRPNSRRCLRMLVGLELGTGGGVCCRDTASPTGLTQMMKSER